MVSRKGNFLVLWPLAEEGVQKGKVLLDLHRIEVFFSSSFSK